MALRITASVLELLSYPALTCARVYDEVKLVIYAHSINIINAGVQMYSTDKPYLSAKIELTN